MFAPMYCILRLAGLQPSNSHHDKYFTVIALIIGSLSSGYLHFFFARRLEDAVLRDICYVVSPFSFVAVIAPILFAHTKKAALLDILNQLSGVGKGSELTEKVMFACLALNLAGEAYRTFTDLGSRFDPFLFLIVPGVFFSLAGTCQHLLLVRRLHVRFSQLNSALSDVAADADLSVAALKDQLNSLFAQHSQLRSLVSKCNSYFAVNLLLGISAKFLFAVVSTFLLLDAISEGRRITFDSVLNVYLMVFVPFLTADLCHRCSEKVN